ncbi:MAG: hypothetical protein PF505_09845, partial [Vallitaleaceae bacterium]|nr:hypothetical protein [Vallitaleaceae bacterium]
MNNKKRYRLPRRTFKKWLITSSQPIIIVIGMLLMCLYAYTAADFLSLAPSDEMSREIKLAEVDYGFSKTIKSHVLTLSAPDGESITVVAIDGVKTRLLKIDSMGNILNDILIDSDLSQATNLEGYFMNDTDLVLFYDNGNLNKLIIDTTTGTIVTNEIVIGDIKSFISHEGYVIYETDNGLYGIDTREDNTLATNYYNTKIKSYETVQDGDNIYILVNLDNSMNIREIHVITIDMGKTTDP